MITLGIDMSSQPKKTAACKITWNGRQAVAETPFLGCNDEKLRELIKGADAVGIDAPFGWPLPFTAAVAAWKDKKWNDGEWNKELRDRLRRIGLPIVKVGFTCRKRKSFPAREIQSAVKASKRPMKNTRIAVGMPITTAGGEKADSLSPTEKGRFSLSGCHASLFIRGASFPLAYAFKDLPDTLDIESGECSLVFTLLEETPGFP